MPFFLMSVLLEYLVGITGLFGLLREARSGTLSRDLFWLPYVLWAVSSW